VAASLALQRLTTAGLAWPEDIQEVGGRAARAAGAPAAALPQRAAR
jgi:hypothetical protein